MQNIHHQTLTWVRTPRAQPRIGQQQVAEPQPLPDRARIRRVAAIHHEQLLAVHWDARASAEVSRQQVETLREFMLELTPADANRFMDLYTEESNAVDRLWKARKRAWRPSSALATKLVPLLVFTVTVFSIALAIVYAL